ncbi:TlpA family protein disulfide reductase [Alteromonas sp. H39]|uniref:TlpA family protein disulfide reductase n=1 Tax=Alteromonas sp. H39 TaxID=3389876 RepID=UPI0039E07070
MKEPHFVARKSPRWARWIRDGSILLLIFIAISAWQNRNLLSEGESVAEENTVLVSLDGEKYIMKPDGQKPTVVYFFAPWCHICKASIGNLEYVDSSRFHVLRIALDYESAEQVRAFVDDVGIDAPVYLGSTELQSKYKITGFPTYYLLNEDYAVVDRTMGYSSAAGLKVRTWLAD